MLLALHVAGQSMWSASSRLSLASRPLEARQGSKAAGGSARGAYRAFVAVDNEQAVASLRERGVKVAARFDGFVLVSIPVDVLPSVAAVSGVRHIALASDVQLCNDSARYYSNVAALHESSGFVAPVRGRGVLVGVVDTGIDFNHINLCDEHGRSRVRAVYMPMDSTGTAPVVNGDTLPGSCYETPELIASLTTDNSGSSHGTHTAGTAAGSCRENGWHGVAPEADIVACGIPSEELTDANIAAALVYIFDYANRVGRPCVVNLSLGSNGGPNDGSSFLCRVFDALTGPGRICVVSAGNDGSAPVCLHGSVAAGDTLTTLLRNPWGGLQREGYVSMWSDGQQHHRSRLVVINRSTGAMEYASPWLDLLPEDSVFTVSSDNDPDFAGYYEGMVEFANALEPGYDPSGLPGAAGRYHSLWALNATSIQAGHLLGMQYVADEPVALSGWTTKDCYFYTFSIDGVTGGTAEGSISDMATTDSVISVGAYCSRSSYVDRNGSIVTFRNSVPTDIADFSSFGPDERGTIRPDLCAPGMVLMSSASRYNTTANTAQWPLPVVVDGVEYPYYANQGTSMSAPVVAGTVALMLEVNGDLGPSAVRNVLQRTAAVDSHVTDGNPMRWGAGKLDAAAAVDDVIRNTLLPGDVNNDHEVNIADVMTLIDVIITGRAGYDASTLVRADVDHDREILVADVNCVIDLILKQ